MAFADADLVAARVRNDSAAQQLRGARRWVLAAVVTLLCDRWSKVADNRLRLSQVSEEIRSLRGRIYHVKTLGRALASLADAQLLTYDPAQGRGGFAVVAIHPRFLANVEPLQRDSQGLVIAKTVTFSEPHPSISQKINLPTLRTARTVSDLSGTRPIEVDVRSDELRQVLRQLPESLDGLPGHLRWRLGASVRAQLARGFTPQQVLAILHAPEPEGLQRPWKLAMWRLAQNLIGSGPRLRPLQAAWDRAQRSTALQAAAAATASGYADVCAVTTEADRTRLLQAHAVKFDVTRIPDPAVALASARRRARMMFPGVALKVALMRWADDVLGAVTPAAAECDLITDLVTAGRCVQCDDSRGAVRPQMLLPVPVCDTCWDGVRDSFDDNARALGSVA